MVHAIISLKCEKGHSKWSIAYDSNECGCHHNGMPCLQLTCQICLEEYIKNNDASTIKDIDIPLQEETVRLLGLKN